MSVKLNTAAESHAKSLIKAGKVDRTSSWSMSAEDENKLLGGSSDWKGYASWFLGTDDSVDAETKGRYKYPFGKDGKVYRRAVIAIKSRAAQQSATSIADAAGSLLDLIDEHTAASAVTPGLAALAQFEKLFAFRSVDLLQFPAADFAQPKPVQLFKWGENAPVDGRKPVVVDDAFAAGIEQGYAKRTTDLPVDYNHSSLMGFQDAPAAGWITAVKVVRPADAAASGLDPGVWLTVDWTASGRKRIEDHEYRYLSAVIKRSKDGGYMPQILGGGLTNTPAIHGLAAVAASEQRLADDGEDDEGADDGAEGKEHNMDVLKEVGYASVDELKSALSELPTLRECAAKADTMAAQLTEANKRAETAEAALKTAKVDAAMAHAEALGRIPAESATFTDEQKAVRAFARKLAERDEELFGAWLKDTDSVTFGKPAPTGKLNPDTSAEQASREAASTFSLAGADPEETELVNQAVALSRAEKIPLETALARLEKGGRN